MDLISSNFIPSYPILKKKIRKTKILIDVA